MTPTTRVTLLERLRADDVQAWTEFNRCYGPFLARVAERLGLRGQDIDEAVQGAIVDFYGARKTFAYDRGRGKFRNYLKHALLNRLLKTRRQTERAGTPAGPVPVAVDEKKHWDDSWERLWEEEYSRHIVWQALERVRQEVEPSTYTAFMLYALKEVDATEVGRQVGLSTAAVYTCKNRMLERLKPVLEEMMEE